MSADIWTYPGDSPDYELLWISVMTDRHTCMFLIGALYHPPKPLYQPTSMLDYIDASIDAVASAYPSATVILAGDFNTLDDTEIVSRNALISIVNRPTRGAHKLDRIYVNDATYATVSVVTSAVKSDHKAVIAYTGPRLKPMNKSRERREFRRRRSPTQHASCSWNTHLS